MHPWARLRHSFQHILPAVLACGLVLLAASPASAAKFSLKVTAKNADGHPTQAEITVTGGIPGTGALVNAYAAQPGTNKDRWVGGAEFTLDASGNGSAAFTINPVEGFPFKLFKALAFCPGMAVAEYFDKDGNLLGRIVFPLETDSGKQGDFKFSLEGKAEIEVPRVDRRASKNVTQIQIGKDLTVTGSLVDIHQPGSVRLTLPRSNDDKAAFEVDVVVKASRPPGKSRQ